MSPCIGLVSLQKIITHFSRRHGPKAEPPVRQQQRAEAALALRGPGAAASPAPPGGRGGGLRYILPGRAEG